MFVLSFAVTKRVAGSTNLFLARPRYNFHLYFRWKTSFIDINEVPYETKMGM